ncbi:DNA adenine methylase [Bacillus thuringiensis]|nr:DNA adenine methylase [Bacillus thuringiensis]
MPEHRAYLEPFFGSGVVIFNKRPATLETVNDIDGDVVNLFQMIRERPVDLTRMLYWTPYSREEYKAVYDLPNDDVDRARRFLVKCWQAIRVKTGSITGVEMPWYCR